MKTLFIVNPKAGKGKLAADLVKEIRAVSEKLSREIEIRMTKYAGDAEDFTAKYIEAWPEETIRIYACGGDGTLNEVVNGLLKARGEAAEKASSRVSIGVIPIGSGNDFSRNFGKIKELRSVERQLSFTERPCDVLRYAGSIEGREETTRYCVNMINIGFDCNVAYKAASLKKVPLLSGPLRYLLGVFMTLVRKEGASLDITLDGEVIHEGELLLTSIANGPCCGGGIYSNPTASLFDGELDVNVVRSVSRRKLLSLLPRYMKGTHMSMPGIEKIMAAVRGKKLTLTPSFGKMRISTDGEISVTGALSVEAVKDAFSVLVPGK